MCKSILFAKAGRPSSSGSRMACADMGRNSVWNTYAGIKFGCNCSGTRGIKNVIAKALRSCVGSHAYDCPGVVVSRVSQSLSRKYTYEVVKRSIHRSPDTILIALRRMDRACVRHLVIHCVPTGIGPTFSS
jgi:hypothetical protein